MMSFALAASAVLSALPALAQTGQPLAETQRLIRQGQVAQALERIDTFLAANPKDAQARFLRGVALTELNRPKEAIEAFQRLSEDYPELPEPYNNLAVLYAQQRQYDKARNALEMAIRTHPAYATAHENLGDIYAKLASQAYDKALQLDSANATMQTKLSMIRELISLSIPQSSRPQPVVRPLIGNLNLLKGQHLAMGGRQPVLPLPEARESKPTQTASRPASQPAEAPRAPAAAPVIVAAAPVAPVVTQPVAATPATAPAQAPSKTAPTATPVTPPPAAAPKLALATPTEAKTGPGQPASQTQTGNPPDATRQVTRALEGWAHAWSSKDFNSYLAAYAPQFDPQGGQSRDAWAAERKARVTKPGPISVTVQGVKVSFESGTRAVAQFRQHYRSSNLNSTATKTLVFTQHGGRWLIAEERIR